MNFFKFITVFFSEPEKKVGYILNKNGLSVSVAESCTGGLVSSLLTDISGSSAYINENIVTYSNEAKISCLGIKRETLSKYGAVSEQTAEEMAAGLIKRTNADYTVTTTGIAGPTGGTDDKPVGLMYVGLSDKSSVKVVKVLAWKFLPRKIMKKYFAKIALNELYNFVEKDIK